MFRSSRERVTWLVITDLLGLELRFDRLSVLQRRLALSAGLGFVGALSWLILAYGRMIHHPHLNAIVFYLPFLPFVCAMTALRVQEVWLRAWPPKRAGDRMPFAPPARPREEEPALAGMVDR
jgi:hypothetical protein